MKRLTHTEPHPWHGRVTMTVYDLNGDVVDSQTFNNVITNGGRNLLAEALRNASLDTEIKYLAWGDNNTAPAVTDTALGNELGRKQVTVQAAGSGTGETDTTVYLGPGDGNGTIEELGWFAGASATATPGSGVMVARVLYSLTKTDLKTVQSDRTDTIG